MPPILIKDPRTLTPDLMPFIVLCNQSDSEISWGIDVRTDIQGDHPVSHAMTCIHQGKFATQGLFYSEVPMENYMTEGTWLAFVQLVGSNPAFVGAYTQAVENRLNLPKWKTFYNFLEIWGQLIGQPELSFPGLFDCSMIDASLLKSADINLSNFSQLIINGMSKYLNPEQLWDIINKTPQVFNIYGVYQYGS